MGIKELMLDTESERGRWVYTKILKLLDSPNRKIFDNPEKLIKASGIMEGQTVLEIGCGSGYFTAEISKILGDSGKLYSTDIHSAAIEETQKKVDSLGLKNVTVTIDDALNSSFEDSFFDVVLLYGVVPSPVIPMKDTSNEIFRLLKSGGIYAVWTKMPFWRPKTSQYNEHFKNMVKNNGVFRLYKK